jgi:O-antigen/teichoic acid export membrane protein
LISGFILLKFILRYFGSEVNGLVTSLTQFLGFISLLDLGVGAVVQSALYKPLADNDGPKISQIVNYSKRFFRIVACIFLAYIVGLCFVYPASVQSQFSSQYIVSLIIIISIALYAQYFFGIANQLLLNADQKLYVQNIINSITVILNTALAILFIVLGGSIHVVKLTTSLVFLLRPLFLSLYVKRHYSIEKTIKTDGTVLKQKWSGLAQHCATVVMNNTDVIVLTILATLSYVSIYSVYHLVVTGVRQFIQAFANGFNSLLGNLYAKEERELLNKTFDSYETFLNYLVTSVFIITGSMVVPFVAIYTRGVNDADYIYPLFGTLMTIAQAFYCLRLPYNSMITAAGHYKQTQKSALIEMTLNIIISVVLVFKFGLIGVAIGTIIAITYRTVYFVIYLSKNIMHRPINPFIGHITVDIIFVILGVLSTRWIPDNVNSYLQWAVVAIEKSVIVLTIGFVINTLIYKKDFLLILRLLQNSKILAISTI